MKRFSADRISARYGDSFALDDVSFDVNAGSLTGILGPNGCGKTTLLKAICGIIPHSGRSFLNGIAFENLSPKQLALICGYIPQRSGLDIDLRVLDAVMMGFYPQLKPLQHPTEQMRLRALEMLDEVGLSGRAESNYQELSEGQKQRCIWARAMVSDCRMLILDEPESAMDFHQRYSMMHMLRRWVNSDDRCALVTLHDPQLAMNMCDQLILMGDGAGINTLYPRTESSEAMQKKLTQIYGSVRLERIGDQYALLEEYEG